MDRSSRSSRLSTKRGRRAKVSVNAAIRFLNTFSEAMQEMQEAFGGEAIALFIPNRWIDSSYVRDPDLRSNVIVSQETDQGTITTSVDCSTLLSQLKHMVDSIAHSSESPS